MLNLNLPVLEFHSGHERALLTLYKQTVTVEEKTGSQPLPERTWMECLTKCSVRESLHYFDY